MNPDQPYQFQPSQQPMTSEPGFRQQSPNKNFTPKFVALIIGLLVLGGVAYGGIWYWKKQIMSTPIPTFTPRSDSTASWQTYLNEEYGFEFQYPVSLKDYSFREIEYMFTIGSLFKVQFVNFSSSPDNESERGHALNQLKSELLLEKEKIQKIGMLLTYGMKALINNQAGDGLFRTATIFTPANDRIWFVMELDLPEDIFRDYINKNISIPESVFQSSENQSRIKMFDQILSTFRFVEPEICIQVVTTARNPKTGEVRDFPTPCDVPEGWVSDLDAQTRDYKRVTDVDQLRIAAELYFDDNGSYPIELSPENLKAYIKSIPKDPLTDSYYNYAYYPADKPIKFQIWTSLEFRSRKLDIDSDINSRNWFGKIIDASSPATELCTSVLFDTDCV